MVRAEEDGDLGDPIGCERGVAVRGGAAGIVVAGVRADKANDAA